MYNLTSASASHVIPHLIQRWSPGDPLNPRTVRLSSILPGWGRRALTTAFLSPIRTKSVFHKTAICQCHWDIRSRIHRTDEVSDTSCAQSESGRNEEWWLNKKMRHQERSESQRERENEWMKFITFFSYFQVRHMEYRIRKATKNKTL